jgi:uncharacterized membrane protein
MTHTVGGMPTPEMLVATPKELAQPLRGQPEKLVRLGGAMLLAAFGLRRGGWLGMGALLAGGAMAYTARQVPAQRWKQKWVTAEAAVTINASATELYERWGTPEELPRWITHLHKVKAAKDPREADTYVLTAKTKETGTLQWKVRCTERIPGERLVWESVRDADVPWALILTLRPAPKDRGTEVHLRMTYGPPGGLLGSIAAGMADDNEPGRSIAQDLRRFKQLIETGEVATTQGQPRGGLGYRIEQVEPPRLLPGQTVEGGVA